MASLTPNEDAFRAARLELPSRKYAPGAQGVIERIVDAIAEASTLAVMRELDRASEVNDILSGIVQGAGSALASAAMSLSDEPKVLATLLSVGVARHAQEAMDASTSGNPAAGTVTIKTTEMATA